MNTLPIKTAPDKPETLQEILRIERLHPKIFIRALPIPRPGLRDGGCPP